MVSHNPLKCPGMKLQLGACFPAGPSEAGTKEAAPAYRLPTGPGLEGDQFQPRMT